MNGADLEDRAARTARVWLLACQERGHHVTPDNRVGLAVAAELVGLTIGRFRNVLTEGTGPPTYRIGGAGHRRTCRLLDLALWLERRRDE